MSHEQNHSTALAESADEFTELAAFRERLNHDLRTPLNAVIGFAELLAMSPDSVRRASDVQHILTAARTLLAILDKEFNPGAQANHHAEPRSRGCDILYIEDDKVNFMLVERILEYRPELRSQQACSGEEGVEMTRLDRPTMVLLDLNLPDMDGAEVLKLLQQTPTTAEIPVVVLSANATPSAIERLLTAGARNYLTKPFEVESFLAVIDEFTATGATRA